MGYGFRSTPGDSVPKVSGSQVKKDLPVAVPGPGVQNNLCVAREGEIFKFSYVMGDILWRKTRGGSARGNIRIPKRKNVKRHVPFLFFVKHLFKRLHSGALNSESNGIIDFERGKPQIYLRVREIGGRRIEIFEESSVSSSRKPVTGGAVFRVKHFSTFVIRNIRRVRLDVVG